MKRFFLICGILLFAAKFDCAAQTPVSGPNPDPNYNRILKLIEVSREIKLPDSVYVALSNFAKSRNVLDASLRRMDFVYKIIYNWRLPVDDRLFACKYYLREYAAPYDYIPIYLIKDMENSLIYNRKK